MYKKVDNNQSAIVRTLRSVPGVTVDPRPAQIGRGFPDIIVGFNRKNYLYEIKQTVKDELTDDEIRFKLNWAGHWKQVTTAEEILKDMGIWQS